LKTAVALDRAERRIVSARARQGVPKGKFDFFHLCAVHRDLFQDVYDWAGEIRTAEIPKGGSQFQLRRFIDTGIADVHARLTRAQFQKGTSADDFANAVAPLIGDVNYVLSFREGNGRTQLQYLKQLAAHAGHDLDLTLFRGKD
jgi:cell filamentation protein